MKIKNNNNINIMATTPNSSEITDMIQSVCASGTLFLSVPSPIPLPKKPPLVIESIALSDWKLLVPESLLKKDRIRSCIQLNLGTYKIKYVSKIIAKQKRAKRINILIPAVKIKTDQEKTTNKV